MNHEWIPLPNHDLECFACGTQNNFGLKMTFASNGKQVRSIMILPDHTKGWKKLVHGGILATVLDEIMSWTVIHLTKHKILTRNINIEFKKPVYIGRQLTATGEIIEINGKNALLQASITDDFGAICCLGKADFVLYTEAEFAQLDII